MKEEEIGGACSTNGKMGSTYRILLRQVHEKSKFADVGVGMRIILKYILFRRLGEGEIQLAVDMYQWRAFVSTIENLFPQNVESLNRLSKYRGSDVTSYTFKILIYFLVIISNFQ
jgi:hypothetical protein